MLATAVVDTTIPPAKEIERLSDLSTHTDNGGCDGAEPPMRFTPLVTSAVRKGIETLIKTADHGPGPYSDLADTECSPADGKHRCPLGMCIDSVSLTTPTRCAFGHFKRGGIH